MEVIVLALEELALRRVYKISLSNINHKNKGLIHSNDWCSSNLVLGEVKKTECEQRDLNDQIRETHSTLIVSTPQERVSMIFHIVKIHF